MIAYIKHLISLLLIFGLTANECSVYSQINTLSYYQVSCVNTRKELNYKGSELYIYSGKTISKKALSVALLTYDYLQSAYSHQIKIILKLQIELYQTINKIKAQHVFLNKISISSNRYSNLYIA